jgi:hypothetical protein
MYLGIKTALKGPKGFKDAKRDTHGAIFQTVYALCGLRTFGKEANGIDMPFNALISTCTALYDFNEDNTGYSLHR